MKITLMQLINLLIFQLLHQTTLRLEISRNSRASTQRQSTAYHFLLLHNSIQLEYSNFHYRYHNYTSPTCPYYRHGRISTSQRQCVVHHLWKRRIQTDILLLFWKKVIKNTQRGDIHFILLPNGPIKTHLRVISIGCGKETATGGPLLIDGNRNFHTITCAYLFGGQAQNCIGLSVVQSFYQDYIDLHQKAKCGQQICELRFDRAKQDDKENSTLSIKRMKHSINLIPYHMRPSKTISQLAVLGKL